MLNYAHDVLKRLQTLLVISPVSITTNMPNCRFIRVPLNESILNEYIWRGGLVVSALISRSSSLGLSSDKGHCNVFLGETLDTHSASLHADV